ncbi:TPA: hypothetical protein ACU967_002258 [Burkholderia contaminans]|uniref:hypothetical protein n=1 Tax=Burkholderia contaminans TaxID=488447 RepID=UPI000D00ADAF|nr:hypothetical protein [Burkholderia contaminans]HDR9065501.1 hypothetical protein [Burkholderia vietnamiensis]MBM6427940.1 hypothetical protein [Burkholderia contaminans]MCA7876771.1 hypothetical protein [Burkholderia contaminans]MDN8024206.1 hypothetical protein [Burkholderia contaminans]PRG12206.1 hypothetical protein C6Q17_14205 [Burkholderia contaminans]
MTLKAKTANRNDGFSAEVHHTGKCAYSVHLSTGDTVNGFRQFGDAFQWADRTTRLGLAEWNERKRYAAR